MLIGFARNTILHVDADSFFAAVEVAQNPQLRGKAVCVLAANAPCILAATYEAKRLGVHTAMPLHEAKKLLPADAKYIPARFTLYAQYSARMFRILRDFSPAVEEYSIDEAFVDLAGLKRLYKKSYAEIAKDIARRVERELGLPVSIGVACTRTLAKIASKKDKPRGLCEVPRKGLEEFLKSIKASDVPGLGYNSIALLAKYGVQSGFDFASMHEEVVRKLLAKPGVTLWKELRGEAVTQVVSETEAPKSLSRIRSFPLTDDFGFLKQHLIYHLAICTYKLRRMHMGARRVYVYIRDRNYNIVGAEWEDVRGHASALRFLSATLPLFKAAAEGKTARSVGVVFSALTQGSNYQLSLFAEDNQITKQENLLIASDKINIKYGAFTVRPAELFKVEDQRSLSIPRLG